MLIWRRLLAEGDKIVTSDKVLDASRNIGKDYIRSLRYLQEHGYLTRVFRGVFYVNSPRERETGALDSPVLKIVAESLALKSVSHWYFGLETALRINGMTHEYFTVNCVITDSYRTTKVIGIAGTRFRFLKWSRGHFDQGVRREFELKFSDKEKTVLDMVYKRYLDRRDEDEAVSPYVEYERMLDKRVVRAYLRDYPRKVQGIVQEML